jgi:hypothetical protein
MSFPFAEEAVEIDAIAQIDRISRRICSFGSRAAFALSAKRAVGEVVPGCTSSEGC